jgi:GDP-L-fucose synthase
MKISDKIFVAGGTGMVGSAVIRKLLSSGYRNIISNCFRKKPVTNHESRITFSLLDLKRQADTERFFEAERPDYVFLAAAKVGGIMANNTYKADFIYDNLMIASNVIHSAYKYGVKKLLNLGSSCIYPKLAPQPMKEEHLLTGLLEPTNEPYAIAKIAAIKLCRYYHEQYGANFISVMPTNLYGTNDNFSLETAHVLPALMRKFHLAKLLRENKGEAVLRDIKKIPIGFNFQVGSEFDPAGLRQFGITPEHVELWGSGSPYREFLHVDDLARACVFLMEKYDFKDIGEFINIGTGNDITIRDLAYMIKETVGFQGDIKWDTDKPEGTPRKLLDVSKIKALGWAPEITLEEGIKRTYNWYLEQ